VSCPGTRSHREEQRLTRALNALLDSHLYRFWSGDCPNPECEMFLAIDTWASDIVVGGMICMHGDVPLLHAGANTACLKCGFAVALLPVVSGYHKGGKTC
jgi:hypothetical protein